MSSVEKQQSFVRGEGTLTLAAVGKKKYSQRRKPHARVSGFIVASVGRLLYYAL